MSDLREAFGALSQPPQPAPKLANCPICGGFVMMLCNCTLRERTCKNGHTWRYENGKVIMGKAH